jgi:MBG domain (YGX type)/Chitobiase/beta-hexosaminidase C-terminal domain
VVAGSGQSAVYGAAFAVPLTVVVKNADGTAISGAVVSFAGAGLKFSSSTATTGSNGEASVTATAMGVGDLTAVASVSGVTATAGFVLTGTKAPLTVTAGNASVAYNQAIPAFTYMPTGFVNGDTTSVLSGAPAEITTAAKGSAPGSYPITITQGTLTAANYTFQFVNGTLTITSLGTAATPVFTPAAGTYATAQSVTISDTMAGATIYYTSNGTTPTTSSAKYIGAIAVSTTETIEAIAVAAGYTNSASASATYTIQPATTSGLQFVTVTPCRIADTRNPTGAFGGPELTAGSTRTFNIPQSACGIPSTAVAYSLNATVVPSQPLGYLTVFPAGEAQPGVSTLNSDGRVKANATITPAGANGGVSVYTSDPTQFVLDIDGYFVPAGTSASGLEFYPLTPCRIADTRTPTGALGGPFLTGGVGRAFPVLSSACGIPSTAKAYSLNVTAVPHIAIGFLTAWPTGEPQPVSSTLNATTGAVTANAAIVPAGTGSEVSIYASNDADAILDVNGYFAPPGTGGLSLYTVAPCRVIDTRYSSGVFDGTLTVPVETSSCAAPAAARAYVFNATVVPPEGLGYLTLFAAGTTVPGVSTLNASDGAITSNLAIVPTTNGSVGVYAPDTTQLILDLSSYFAP